MLIGHLAELLIAVIGIAVLCGPARAHPLIALIAATAAFGMIAGMSVSLVSKSFGAGFADTLAALGLVILGSRLIADLGARTGASARIAPILRGCGGVRMPVAMAALGLVTGVASSPAAAFAALSPLREPASHRSRQERAIGAVSLSLALSASHGLLLPAPGVVAAAVILSAEPLRMLAFGVPAALIAAAIGIAYAKAASRRLYPNEAERRPSAPASHPRGALSIVIPVALMVALLLIQSLGGIPSEPLGGGPARELLLGLGRPLTLFTVGVGAAILVSWRDWPRVFRADWVGPALAASAGIILVTACGGGLQRVLQETGMAELAAGKLLELQLGLALPFLVAATVKTLQGSSLVAAITAAGMVEPLLAGLGLDSPQGRALAALAVGSGAVTISHINDGFFWLVAMSARLRPAQALALHSAGTLLQGIAILAMLIAAGALAG